MKTIVIINSFFPGNSGEPFLVNEIDVAETMNVNILVFPFSLKEHIDRIGKRYTVCLNDNKSRNDMANKIIYSIKAICTSYFWKEIRRLICNKKCGYSSLLQLLKFTVNGEIQWNFLKKRLNKMGCSNSDIIFYSYWMWFHAYAAVKAKKYYKGSKFVTRCHRFDLYEELYKGKYIPYRNLILSTADRIYPISRDGKEYLRKKYNLYKKARVSYLGTNDFGINLSGGSDFYIVSCSNMVPVKRLNILIEALSKVSREAYWIHFGDGDLRDELTDLAGRILPGNIHWKFAGYMENKEILKQYKTMEFSVFVNVSESEGLPVSIMEAASFAIPIIATDVGGTSEIVRDGYNGYLVPKDINAEELKNKLLEFIETPDDVRGQYRMNSRKMWEENFNAKENYKRFYLELLSI